MRTATVIAFAAVVVSASTCIGQTSTPQKAVDPLVVKHDVNGNGKIDVYERKPYVRDLARQRRAEARAFAAQRPVLTPQERQFLRMPRLTPALIQQYDANKNRRLDMSEHLQMQHAAADAARAEFRRFDTNQDGQLDREEQKAVRESQRRDSKASATPAKKVDEEEVDSGSTQPDSADSAPSQ
jgi:Ca2+-binding EF-hand superfamily protein